MNRDFARPASVSFEPEFAATEEQPLLEGAALAWLQTTIGDLVAVTADTPVGAPLRIRRDLVNRCIAQFDRMFSHEITRHVYLAPHLEDGEAVEIVNAIVEAKLPVVRHLTGLPNETLAKLIAKDRSESLQTLLNSADCLGADSNEHEASHGVVVGSTGDAKVPAHFLATLGYVAYQRLFSVIPRAALGDDEFKEIYWAAARSMVCEAHRAGHRQVVRDVIARSMAPHRAPLRTLVHALYRDNLPYFYDCLMAPAKLAPSDADLMLSQLEMVPGLVASFCSMLGLPGPESRLLTRSWTIAQGLTNQGYDLPTYMNAFTTELMDYAEEVEDPECLAAIAWLNDLEPFDLSDMTGARENSATIIPFRSKGS